MKPSFRVLSYVLHVELPPGVTLKRPSHFWNHVSAQPGIHEIAAIDSQRFNVVCDASREPYHYIALLTKAAQEAGYAGESDARAHGEVLPIGGP